VESKNFKINKGIELMLRRAKLKEENDSKPSRGFAITKIFTLLKTKVYFNFELWWERKAS
jgi:hypothetical protein